MAAGARRAQFVLSARKAIAVRKVCRRDAARCAVRKAMIALKPILAKSVFTRALNRALIAGAHRMNFARMKFSAHAQKMAVRFAQMATFASQALIALGRPAVR